MTTMMMMMVHVNKIDLRKDVWKEKGVVEGNKERLLCFVTRRCEAECKGEEYHPDSIPQREVKIQVERETRRSDRRDKGYLYLSQEHHQYRLCSPSPAPWTRPCGREVEHDGSGEWEWEVGVLGSGVIRDDSWKVWMRWRQGGRG